jgi:hypothetical protein
VPRFRSPARLALQPLEGRDVPAGSITASPISATGVLTVTGDDDANDVQITVTAGSVTLTSVNGTLINNSSNPVVINGVVKSIKADFKGGADDVSVKPDADFVLAGPATFALGSGDNVLTLVTTGRIGLAGLTVSALDGLDVVTVQGGANSAVGGTAKFTYGAGGSTTTLTGVAFAGVNLTAGDAVTNPNTVAATNVTTARPFLANLGNSFPAVLDFTGSTLAGLTATGYSVSSILTATNVTGTVSFKAGYSADVQARGLTVGKNLTLTAPNPNFEATDDPATVASDPTTITGNLALTGTGWTSVVFGTDVLSEVKGNVTVKGGWFTDVFDANEFFKVGKNLSLTLNGGDNVVNLGNGQGLVAVAGTLTVKGGAGNDLFTLDRVLVTGAATVQTFGGADVLRIETGSTFLGTFSADLGAGDDSIEVAQLTGSTAPVTFAGRAKILGGLGNDLLLLGFAPDLINPPDGGDANSRVVFGGVGSVVDGGLGLNFFDDSTDQSTGVVPVNW